MRHIPVAFGGIFNLRLLVRHWDSYHEKVWVSGRGYRRVRRYQCRERR